MNKKVGLKDIAKAVGVSVAAVSYVLSKGEENRVSPEMAKKIKETAKSLNYRPNILAKSLKMGKSMSIGLIVADISNPFFSHIARIIEDEAKKHNYTVIFGSSDENKEKSDDLINFLLNRQVDGFIIAPVEETEEQIEKLLDNNVPLVLIDRSFPKLPTNHVIIDNNKAAYEAVSRLVSTGHQRVGIISYSQKLNHMKERANGYKQALKDNGIHPKKAWINEINYNNMDKEIAAAIDKLLVKSKEVDALFFATNTLAIQSLKYIDKIGLRVPDDVAVISFDQGDAFDFYYCPMTHIKQPLQQMGKSAVNVLLEKMENNKGLTQISLEADLVIKSSCK
ncbi:LacI family DNA-binding transcriptional regulator [Echinicola sediminis]